jgi:amino acid adenylation domain-containing protein
METIHGKVSQHAGRDSQSLAILAAGRPPLTYDRLDSQIRYVGEQLRCAGVRPADRVALVLPEGAESAVASVAVAANAACAPLNPACSEREFESHLAALRATALLVPHGGQSPAIAVAISLNIRILRLLPETASPAGLFSLSSYGEPHNNDEPALGQGDPALLLFTSGTAARPKLVPLTHQNLCVSAYNICSALQLQPSDRCLGVMPLYHIHGLSTLFASLISGGSYVSMASFSTESFFACLDELRPTWYSASPAIHRVILDQIRIDHRNPRESGLRFIRSASAPMPPQLIADVERAFGVPFVEAYGMTEAAPQIASNRLPPFKRKPGSVGIAAGPEVAIRDEAGRILPPDSNGEIVIRGPNVVQAYEGDAALNEAAFSGGWLRTGDLGTLDADGYLFVTGRLKEIINRGGEKISPQLVERVLLEHPAIAQAVVFGVPHSALGENVAAAVVLKPAEKLDQPVHQIRSFVAERLARFRVPQQIVFVDQIPRGPTGKLSRKDLAQALGLTHDGQRNLSRDDKTAPRTAAERRVVEVFAEVLRTDPPGIHDDFFELGGHSLMATRLLTRLKQIFHVTLPIDSVFENPTVARLSECIGAQMVNLVADGAAQFEQGWPSGVDAHWSDARIPRRHDAIPVPLSLPQQRVYFLDQIGSGSAYNMSASLWLTGPVDERALALSVDEIRRRHDILRTTFHMRGERPVQVVSPPQASDLPVIDLTAHPASTRTAEAIRLATEEAAQPFDLANGPLFRAKLIRLAPEERAFLLTMHHIISDGWSIDIFYTELRQLYDAFRERRASPLKELPIQYGDFAAWQHQSVEAGVLTRQINYWTGRLDKLPLACTFPTDRPRPAIQSYRGAIHQVSIDRQLIDQLKGLSQRENVSLFMTFLAAFKTLLFRHNGQDDCVVGIPISNRQKEELESLIGLFANTLVFRTGLAGDPSFVELLARIRSTALGAYANQDVPLERIVQELKVSRDLSLTPLFQVMFAFQNVPGTTGSASQAQPPVDRFARPAFDLAPGLSAQPFRVDNGTAKFDLTLYLSENNEGMSATWQFNADLFEGGTVQRVARRFHTLLEGIAANPEHKLSELRLVPEAERRQIEVEWTRTENRDLLSRNFLQLFEAQVEQTPSAVAVLSDDGQFTYRELNQRANQFARLFQRQGIAREKLIGVCLPRSADTLAVLLGIWKTGGAFLPLDPDYPPERNAFMLRDAGAMLLITQTSLLPRFASVFESSAPDLPETLCIDALDGPVPQEETQNLEVTLAGDTPAYAIYTSGSMGKPKGVMITHANVGHYVQAMAVMLSLTADDRYLHTASFSFSSAVRQFAVPLSCGAAVSIASAEGIRDPQLLYEQVRQRGVSVMDFVPSFSAGCLQILKSLEPSVRARLLDNHVRLMLSASEPLPAALVGEWRRLCKPVTKFVNMFGQTETTGIVMAYPIPTGENKAAIVPIGRPIANAQAYVLDASHRPVPVGVCGELYIGGGGIGRGYINQPEQTAKSFVPNPFSQHAGKRLYRTGDVARYRSDGVFEIVGRVDEQIKIRGFRIEPGEIETVIRTYPDVRECVVSAVDEAAGEDQTSNRQRLVAFVVADDQSAAEAALFSQRLREFLRGKLPDYMLPQQILALDRLPRTPNGKIDRQALFAHVRAATALDSAMPALSEAEPQGMASTDAERILLDVWKKVLTVDRIGVDDNFFDLGGNSILSINIVLDAKRAGLQIDLKQIYQYQTIAELARAVQLGNKTGQTGLDVPASSEQKSRILVTIESLRAYGHEALMRAGLTAEGAAIVTEVQLEASMRGHPTHDMVSIPRYAVRIASGKLNSRPQIRIERETANTVQIDGDNGPGQWVSTVAMEAAIRKAREQGVGIVSVRRSNHFGAAGHYVWQATKNGLIGLCTTNGPLILAPTGGITPTFGNNPLGVGIPAGRHFPILLDIAMSVAPRGKIGLAVAEGKPLPPGWILDRFGRPSTDLADLAAGLGMPIGGHKGYGLALVLEVLAGVLSGAGFSADHSRDKLRGSSRAPDYGHLFIAIDPERFMPASEFAARVDRMIEQTKNGEHAENVDEILIPGEMELRARDQSLKEGVRLRPSTHRALVTYGRQMGLGAELKVVSRMKVPTG